ncbi:hypothetical protein V8D89_002133 [Ganoderma adspersum]
MGIIQMKHSSQTLTSSVNRQKKPIPLRRSCVCWPRSWSRSFVWNVNPSVFHSTRAMSPEDGEITWSMRPSLSQEIKQNNDVNSDVSHCAQLCDTDAFLP